MGRCGLVVAWPETIWWPWLWPLSVGKAWLYMDIVGSLFPQICRREQYRENAWLDPYMVTLGWACNTWWVGTPWDNLDIDRYAVGRHAIGHSRLHSDPGPSLVSLWRIRGRTETLICRTCKLRQHAYSYWVKSGSWENHGWKMVQPVDAAGWTQGGKWLQAQISSQMVCIPLNLYISILHMFEHITVSRYSTTVYQLGKVFHCQWKNLNKFFPGLHLMSTPSIYN